MIKLLKVSNFAIIEDIEVKFDKGLTVITGQTGAGKSLIIDTISLLLGSRADSDMIRYNECEAKIIGVFDYDKRFDELFNNYGIKINDDLIIERIITKNKNTIKVNNTSISLNILKSIAIMLADIHVQNDTYKMFDPESYMSLLDPKDDELFNKYLNNYTKALYDYDNSVKNLNKIEKSQNEVTKELEFLEYEKNEIDELDLKEDIDKELEEEISKLENFDKISNSLNMAYQYLDNDIILDSIYNAAKEISSISSYDGEFKDINEKLLDSYYVSSEMKDIIKSKIDNLEYDEDEFNNLQDRLNNINKAKDKYKKSVNELLEYYKEISLKIDLATNFDNVLKKAKEDVIKYFNILKDNSIKLTDYRKKIAKKLEEGIIKECLELDLDNTTFEISFNEINYDNPFDNNIFNSNGVDKIDFLISFNKGEPKRPLYKVASGGEASRLMLAFKSYLSNKSQASLLVLDEIDTGISGITAKHIAEKIYNISKNMQVLCITHLPFVAAIGDHHKYISKEEINGRTYTRIKDLNYNERIEEIALMISGDKLSIYALENANELLG